MNRLQWLTRHLLTRLIIHSYKFLCLSKIPIPQRAPEMVQEGEGSPPVTPIHPNPPQSPKIPPSSLIKLCRHTLEKISVEKLGNGVRDGTRSVLLRAVTGNAACSLCAGKWQQLNFLCWHLFPWPPLSSKPSWKPSPWSFTPNYPKGWTKGMSNDYVKQ